jgi:hypothetical protein
MQKIVENKTAIGRERGTKVNAILPTKEAIKPTEIFLVTNNSVSLNNSNVNKKEIKNRVLTTKGRINCAARYLCNKSFIDLKLLQIHLSIKKWQNKHTHL